MRHRSLNSRIPRSICGSAEAGENISSAAIFGCEGTFSLATALPQIHGGMLELSEKQRTSTIPPGHPYEYVGIINKNIGSVHAPQSGKSPR